MVSVLPRTGADGSGAGSPQLRPDPTPPGDPTAGRCHTSPTHKIELGPDATRPSRCHRLGRSMPSGGSPLRISPVRNAGVRRGGQRQLDPRDAHVDTVGSGMPPARREQRQAAVAHQVELGPLPVKARARTLRGRHTTPKYPAGTLTQTEGASTSTECGADRARASAVCRSFATPRQASRFLLHRFSTALDAAPSTGRHFFGRHASQASDDGPCQPAHMVSLTL